MGNKIEELLDTMRLGELLHRKECPGEKRKHVIICVLAIIGAVAAVAAIAYAVYRYMNPDYLEDFDDDFDDYEDDTEDTSEDNKTTDASES